MKKYILMGIIFLLIIGLTIGCAPNQRVDPNTPGENDPMYNDPNNVNPNNTNPRTTDPDNMNPGTGAPNEFVNPANPAAPNPAVPQENRTPGDTAITPRNNNTGDGAGTADSNRSNEIVEIVEDIDGVNNATAVVAGETAYVGIDIGRNTSDSDTNKLKEEVGKRVREEEENITRVYVSADVDTVERLRGMGREIGEGRPISGFLNELTEMFRRPTPSVE